MAMNAAVADERSSSAAPRLPKRNGAVLPWFQPVRFPLVKFDEPGYIHLRIEMISFFVPHMAPRTAGRGTAATSLRDEMHAIQAT